MAVYREAAGNISDSCVPGGPKRNWKQQKYGRRTEQERGMDSTEDIVRLLDSMGEAGASRIKVETSKELDSGEVKKTYHHGRCDVGSPFATGKLFDLEEE